MTIATSEYILDSCYEYELFFCTSYKAVMDFNWQMHEEEFFLRTGCDKYQVLGMLEYSDKTLNVTISPKYYHI